MAVVFKVWHLYSQFGTMAELQAGGLFTITVVRIFWHHVGPSIKSLNKSQLRYILSLDGTFVAQSMLITTSPVGGSMPFRTLQPLNV